MSQISNFFTDLICVDIAISIRNVESDFELHSFIRQYDMMSNKMVVETMIGVIARRRDDLK